MCLTGVDYFSTLGYQPGIAFLAAGALSPIATLILVLLTLFGALPIYNRVASESPHGEGSISMLEHLLSRWKGKLFVLVLLGFVATDFVITITLSAADATAHVIENPFVQAYAGFLSHRIVVTLVLVALLGAIFLKGFKEAIGIAVILVGVYLLLNVLVVGRGLYELFFVRTGAIAEWYRAVLNSDVSGFHIGGNPLLMIAVALYVFRVVGFLAFELTGDRNLLLLFPNVFELWFLAVAAVHRFRPDFRWTGLKLAVVLTAVTAVKLLQEWALHVGRIFDGFSSLDAIDGIWRWITGGG